MEFIRKSRHSVFVKMSSDQLDQLDVFKKEMNYVLQDHIEMSISIIDNHLDLHLHKHAKYEELLKMRKEIINGNSFNKYYADVVKLEYPGFKFPDNDLFLNFVYWSKFFEDDQIAILRLKEYIDLQCIDFSIDYHKPYKLQQPLKSDNSNHSKNENKHADIFKDNGFEIFLKWMEISNDEPYKKMSFIFQKLNSLDKIRNSNFKIITNWLIENNFIDKGVGQNFRVANSFISPSNILLKNRTALFNTINTNK